MHYIFRERSCCPACLSGDIEIRFTSDFKDPPIRGLLEDFYRIDPEILSAAPYQLATCRNCSLIFQTWVGEDRLLADLYGVWLEDHSDPEADPLYRSQIDRVAQSRDAHEIAAAASFLTMPVAEMLTLDFGIGWALWARIARELGCRSHGFDLSPPRMKFAGRHGVEPVEMDDLARHRFHFINTDQVFEHLADPYATAQTLASALAPGGILKISVPNGDRAGAIVESLREGRWSGSAQDIMPVHPLEHVNCFTSRTIAVMAERLGLREVRPSLRDSYAFLARRGGVSVTHLKNSAKELVRPLWTFHSRGNLYRWWQKPA